MKNLVNILSLAVLIAFGVPKVYAQVTVGISVRIAPPALPVYVQPACPVDGYLWQPGYWAYNDGDGYYWVPGVWVAPPDPGYLWTPAYWGYEGGYYGFHSGYWGIHVGYYGGINYGYGYGGYGFGGGRWNGNRFSYNTAVMHVNRTIVHNTYIDRTVIRNTYVNNHKSYNGPGGVTARPRPEEQAAMREHHLQPTGEQLSHQQMAGKNRSQFQSVNHGRPAAAAMNKVNGHAFTPRGTSVRPSAIGNNPAVNKRQQDNNAGKKPEQQKRGIQMNQRIHSSQQAPQNHMQQRAPQQQRQQPQQQRQQPQQQHQQPQQQRQQPQQQRQQPQQQRPQPQQQHQQPQHEKH